MSDVSDMSVSAQVVVPVLPVVDAGKKRVFPIALRAEIVSYYDTLVADGSKGQYLRRNGLYDSMINSWRKDIDSGVISTKKPGRKTLDPKEKELRHLRGQVLKLEADLEKANLVIDVQKKVSRLLEMHMGQAGIMS